MYLMQIELVTVESRHFSMKLMSLLKSMYGSQMLNGKSAPKYNAFLPILSKFKSISFRIVPINCGCFEHIANRSELPSL